MAALSTRYDAGRYAEVLARYCAADDREAVLRLLDRHGMSLIDSGAADVVRTCLSRFVGNDERDAALIAVKAALASQAGHHDAAEAWFNQAIALARDPELEASLVYRSSLGLLRRGRTDCIDALERCAARSSSLETELLATLSTAYVVANRLDDARRAAWRARDQIGRSVRACREPRTLHQIAYAALRCGEFAEAKRFARETVSCALHQGNHDLASRGYSVLYELAQVIECDPEQALRYIEAAGECAAKSGDAHVRVWATMGALYIEADRGNVTAMRALEASLDAVDVVQSPEESGEALLPVEALRRAWNGEFAQAYRLLGESAEVQITADRRALRFAEMALYAAAAGLKDEARTSVDSAEWAMHEALSDTRHALQAQAYLTLAAALASGVADAEPRLTRFLQNRLDHSPTMEALARSVRAVHAYWSGARNHGEVLESLDMMREQHLGGIARLFESLPVPQ